MQRLSPIPFMYELHVKRMGLGVGGRELPLFAFGGLVRTAAGVDNGPLVKKTPDTGV